MINICLSADDRYAEHAGVVIASALKSSSESDDLCFYILDGDISEENKSKIYELKKIKDCKINFVQIDKNKFDIYKSINTHQYVSIATYYRLKLGELLPNVKRIIYLDCDMIVNSSLAEIFNIDFDQNYICGVLDARVKRKKIWKDKNYVNAGMLVLDLEKIRNDKIEDKFIEYTTNNSDKIDTGDQDIINFTLENKIKILPDEWNVQVSSFTSRTTFTNNPKIIHYIGVQKPWIFGSYNFFKDKYFEALALTPWAISKEGNFKWMFLNPIVSAWNFIKKRPLFFIRPKFWKCVYLTYGPNK